MPGRPRRTRYRSPHEESLRKKLEIEDDGGILDYYWWSRLIYGLATNLHCSERDILSMRWDRALAYADEIRIDLGQHPDRPEPILPEEEALKQIMREKMKQGSQSPSPSRPSRQ